MLSFFYNIEILKISFHLEFFFFDITDFDCIEGIKISLWSLITGIL